MTKCDDCGEDRLTLAEFMKEASTMFACFAKSEAEIEKRIGVSEFDRPSERHVRDQWRSFICWLMEHGHIDAADVADLPGLMEFNEHRNQMANPLPVRDNIMLISGTPGWDSIKH